VAIVDRTAPQHTSTAPPSADESNALAARVAGMGERGVPSPFLSWFTTVDHKRIGLMYGAAGIFFFLFGGVEALLIRTQLAGPEGRVLSAETYNRMFTMHGTTMIFLAVMPIGSAFANYLVPLQIGARDVAFPRLNAFSFWVYLAGATVLTTSVLLGEPADGGWFMYQPNASSLFSPSLGNDYWSLGLQLTGVASLVGSINLIVTILNMRAPGMRMMHVPIFTWMVLVVQFLLVFAVPVITLALFLMTLQRQFGASFFDVSAGADPLLWQHLFWIFGHPEVYILILPSFGVVSEIIPVFSKKPLFGYRFMVFSGIAIGFVGWGVWAHHMFASGLGPVSVAAFSVTTMLVAVPTGVKIVNWVMTMWGGKLEFNTPLLFSIGLVTMFTIGGLSGVTHAVSPSDTQQTDTLYIVAHFHYVLFGGAIFGIFAGAYYWWPKVFGKLLSDRLGKWHFWLFLAGMNLTFGPMHILGLQGQPRRMYTFTRDRAGEGFFDLVFWNRVSTVGAYTLAIGMLVFLSNVLLTSQRAPKLAPISDPWDARSLEWMTTSPPQPHNWDAIPHVHGLDEFFHRKWAERDTDGGLERVASGEEVIAEAQSGPEPGMHLPSPSIWPVLTAVGLMIVVFGVLYQLTLAALAGAFVLFCLFSWALQPSVRSDAPS
jgi:cytochrome c oxidase subunit 1